MKKKFLIFGVTILFLFLQIKIVNADVTSGDFTYSNISSSTIKITGYTGTSTDLTIPSSLDEYSVTSIGDGAFYSNTSLTSITIPSGVTNIGENVFSGDTNLSSVTIPSSVTSIGGGAFYGDTSLASLTIPYGVTNIGENTFSGDSNLNNVIIPSSVISIGGGAFYGNTSLTNITISYGITSIGDNMFSGDINLNNVVIPSSVTSIGGGAFYGNTGLTNITIPSSVTSVGVNAFSGDTSLVDVTIPSSVTNISDGAFYGCTNLTEVYFLGNAPQIGSSVFDEDPSTIIHHLSSASGWSNPWNGYTSTTTLNLPYVISGSSKIYIHPTDNSSIAWGGLGTTTGATSATDGATNTATIVSVLGAGSYAAQVCHNLSFDGYTDWYLPARYQFDEIYNASSTLNEGDYSGSWTDFNPSLFYWSSTEYSASNTIVFRFMDHFTASSRKDQSSPVRCVRSSALSNITITTHHRRGSQTYSSSTAQSSILEISTMSEILSSTSPNILSTGTPSFSSETNILQQVATPSPTTALAIISSSTAKLSFLRTLSLGSVGNDVKLLQIFLNNNGFIISLKGSGSKGNETNYFGTLTKNALIKFQEANAKDILVPLHLTKGTGVFERMTRKFANSILNQ